MHQQRLLERCCTTIARKTKDFESNQQLAALTEGGRNSGYFFFGFNAFGLA